MAERITKTERRLIAALEKRDRIVSALSPNRINFTARGLGKSHFGYSILQEYMEAENEVNIYQARYQRMMRNREKKELAKIQLENEKADKLVVPLHEWLRN